MLDISIVRIIAYSRGGACPTGREFGEYTAQSCFIFKYQVRILHMQYLVLLLLIFVAVAIIITLLPYVSLIIMNINNVNARVYTLYNSCLLYTSPSPRD